MKKLVWFGMDSQAILGIMQVLLANPVNAEFALPIEPGTIPGYDDMIDRPIDLTTIRDMVRDGEYKKSSDWYKDVTLVYKNSIKFNGEASGYGVLAKHNLSEFRRLAAGYECKDTAEWYGLVRKKFNAIAKLAANSPVPQAVDPCLDHLIVAASKQVPLKVKEIGEMIDAMNKWTDDTERMRDVVLILKRLQPELDVDSGEDDVITVDVEKLNDAARAGLYIYAKAHGS